MRLVHAADLHLDSPLTGLERYDGAPVEQIRRATRRALENLVDLCLRESADLLLVAGDLFDGNWKDYSTGLFLSQQLSRLRQGDVRVVMIRGNHDAASRITRYLQLPENVIELPTEAPGSHVFEDLGVVVHGQGFERRAVTDDLASTYPEPLGDLFNVGLLHTAATGRAGHEPYAPCSVETLVNKGYEYWALGHVHTREVLHESPWIVFPGNLQGRHARELGAKGATVVDVVDGHVKSVGHRVLDVVRWGRVEVDATDAATAEDAIDGTRSALEGLVAEVEGRTVAARVRVVGSTRAHTTLLSDVEKWVSQMRALATDVAGDQLWLEQVQLATSAPLDLDELGARDDAIGQVCRSLRALRDDEERQAGLLDALADLKNRLPAELREGEGGIRLDGPRAVTEALADVEQLLLPRLAAAGDDE